MCFQLEVESLDLTNISFSKLFKVSFLQDTGL